MSPNAVVAVTLFSVYLSTMLPSVGVFDTAKFGYLGLVLGTAHQPGYPLYTMIDAVWVRIFPFGEVAWRVNLLSAVFAVATCLVVLWVLRRLGVSAVPATVAAVSIGLLRAFWAQSVVAEVYTLNTLSSSASSPARGLRAHARPAVRGDRTGGVRAVVRAPHLRRAAGLLVYLVWRRAAFVFRPRYLALFGLAGVLAVASYGY